MIDKHLIKIDSTTINNHRHLEKEDLCFYFGEYHGRQGYGYSPMNQLIFNLKKPLDKKDTHGWSYKDKAIQTVANMVASLKEWGKLKQYTWIPMPSSKVKGDPTYDDRLMKILLQIQNNESGIDVREILTIKSNRLPAHDPQRTSRPTIQDHLNNLLLDKSLIKPEPKAIVIFDDVITTGASYKAALKILKDKFQNTPTIGIFIARNIPDQNLIQ